MHDQVKRMIKGTDGHHYTYGFKTGHGQAVVRSRIDAHRYFVTGGRAQALDAVVNTINGTVNFKL